ncbi:MAG: hypothetical protein ACTHN5_14875 [Phycisphaerae bacterium]
MCRKLPLILLPISITLAACSTSTPKTAAIPPLYVPSATLTQLPNTPPAANAYAVLPESDSLTLWVPRQDKGAWGPYILQQASTYSVFTYDQQLISNLWGPSYRYRWITQQGVTIP